MKKQNGFTLIELLICIAIVGILLAICVGSCTQSDGSRVGTIVKFSKKGIFMKTWEGEMLLGDKGSMSAQHWEFSVDEKTIADQIEAAMDEQKLVKLTYEQKAVPRPTQGETLYFVTKVTEIKKE